MKKTIIFVAVCVMSVGVFAKGSGHVNSSSHAVDPYVTKNGTYVAAHRATNPNKTTTDNYDEKGNVNPYTGKKGTK